MSTFLITKGKNLHLWDIDLKTLEMRDLTKKGSLLFDTFQSKPDKNILCLTTIKAFIPFKQDNIICDIFIIAGYEQKKYKFNHAIVI